MGKPRLTLLVNARSFISSTAKDNRGIETVPVRGILVSDSKLATLNSAPQVVSKLR